MYFTRDFSHRWASHSVESCSGSGSDHRRPCLFWSDCRGELEIELGRATFVSMYSFVDRAREAAINLKLAKASVIFKDCHVPYTLFHPPEPPCWNTFPPATTSLSPLLSVYLWPGQRTNRQKKNREKKREKEKKMSISVLLRWINPKPLPHWLFWCFRILKVGVRGKKNLFNYQNL